jgi:hypothetical protein
MERFVERHRDRVIGVLSGFDRMLFRGSLRSISYTNGIEAFLCSQHVLYKNFGAFVQKLSNGLRDHAKRLAQQHQRPFQFLASAKVSKEAIARGIMERDGIHDGLICVLSCVESCQTFQIRKDAETGHIHLTPALRKCLFLYFYFIDREFGFMHVRLQTWLPFAVQVCMNGREYLARQMDRAGIGYERRDNCFTRIDDLPRAQALLDKLGERHWPSFLNRLARRVNPWILAESGLDLHGYYWTMREGEYATDVMFKDAASLAELYPRLVDHAIQQFSCQDVLRFLGRRTTLGRFRGECHSNITRRMEGVRIKHWVEENSIKMYDKQGSVLRIETTMNNPRRFKVRRRVTRKGKPGMGWLPLRKGVADLPRRVEICRAANGRYLEALAVVNRPSPTCEVLDPVSRPVVRESRPYRPLRPISCKDAEVFQIILRGEFSIQGFRNKDLREHLRLDRSPDRAAQRRNSGRITRWLRLLRAHGLINKVSTTRYYRISEKGHHVMTTALRLREIDLSTIAA